MKFTEGNKVTYTGPNFNKNTRRAVCVSGEYVIREWTFINIEFEGETDFHPANVENLELREY